MKKSWLKILLAFVAIGAIVAACEKDDEETAEATLDAAVSLEESEMASAMFEDAFDFVDDANKTADEAIDNDQLLKGTTVITDDCPVITISTPENAFFPRTVTIDFGESCIDGNGIERSGKIISTTTGRYIQEGTQHIVTFENYYVNEHHVEGTKTVTNNGFNDNNKLELSVVIENGKITAPQGAVTTYEANRMLEWTSGMLTPFLYLDDVYTISSTATGTNTLGDSYSVTTTSPLVKAAACPWIRSGVVETIVNDNTTVILDYGTGDCDAMATLTINDQSWDIILRLGNTFQIQ